MSQIFHIEPARVIHELIFKPIGTYLFRYPTENDQIIFQIALQGQTNSDPYVVLSVRVDETVNRSPIMHYYLPLNERDEPNDDLPKLIKPCLIESEETDWTIDHARFHTGYMAVFEPEVNAVKMKVQCDDYQRIPIYRKSIHHNNNELSILKTLCHFHIVRFYGIYPEMNALIFADHGESLKDKYPQERLYGDLLSQQLAMIGYQIACGMMYLEAKGIIHRDLHAGNILIDQSNFIRIANFEHAIRVNDETAEEMKQNFQLRRLAPECLPLVMEHECQSSKSDVWAYGLIFIELTIPDDEHLYPNLLTSDDLTEELTQLIQYIISNRQIHSKPEDCPENIYEILKHCWTFDQNERISFIELRDIMLTLFQSSHRIPDQ